MRKVTTSGTEIRFIDLCAGMGGFHLALSQAQASGARRRKRVERRLRFRCVLASELDPELRELYVQNFPEVRDSYQQLYPPSSTALTPGLDDLYEDGELQRVHGDLRSLVDVETRQLKTWRDGSPIVPEHDLLCAGFPCQPFSKSGAQRGFDDLNGTVFGMLSVIVRERRPRWLLLENVGNFEQHDKGNTWATVQSVLDELGYDFRATTHVGSKGGGLGLLSPHQLGFPHHRERFFLVAQLRDFAPLPETRHPFPLTSRSMARPERHGQKMGARAAARLRGILEHSERVSPRASRDGGRLRADRLHCVQHWNSLLQKIREHEDRVLADPSLPSFRPLPSFPIWGYELDPWNHYPAQSNPRPLLADPKALVGVRREMLREIRSKAWWRPLAEPAGERAFLAEQPGVAGVARWTAEWPRYASSRDVWPSWKRRFIERSREWGEKLWTLLEPGWLRDWMDVLATMPASHQKLEWNCRGEELDLWQHILQFRPSGLRVKRFKHVPALVALTTTQIPIVPRQFVVKGEAPGRHLLEEEALQLQGFPREWAVPSSRSRAFKAFGNAVHVGLVAEVVLSWLLEQDGPYDAEGRQLVLPAPAPPLPPRPVEAGRVDEQDRASLEAHSSEPDSPIPPARRAATAPKSGSSPPLPIASRRVP